MGEILGLGITHYPGLCYKGNISRRIFAILKKDGDKVQTLYYREE